MMQKIATIPKRFYLYQKERFPIILLAISLFPAILSSGAVFNVNSLGTAYAVLVACIAYLLHIRVIDEHRDFHHDNVHHTDRPIQTGIISKQELALIDTIAVVLILIVGVYSSLYALGMAVIMLCYSYLAGKEFFFGEKIRKYFFFYNTVNLLQMILMQIFVYSVFAGFLHLNPIIGLHFLFTTTGTIILEFIRKLKIPGGDGSGRDTYTWYLGFGNSLVIYGLLVLANAFLFSKIVISISSQPFTYLIFSGFLAIILVFLAFVHWLKRNRSTDQLLQLLFLLSYGILNLIIYFLIF